MSGEILRDVFLSYSSQDRLFVERLAADLVSYGLKVWWDQWEMQVGDSLVVRIQEGIQSSSWLVVVLSPNSAESSWVKRELASAIADEIASDQVRVLPALLHDCSLPPFIRDKLYADFRESYELGLEALLGRLAPARRPEIQRRLLSDDEGTVLAAWSRLAQDEKARYRRMLFREAGE
jgi:hypothetical protein